MNEVQPVPQGPRGLPVLGSMLDFQRRPLEFLAEVQRTYGDIAEVRVGPLRLVIVSSPSGLKHVLQDNYVNYRKSRAFDKIRSFVGEGLLTSEGDFWLRQRRLAQPAFHRQRLAALGDLMTAETLSMLESWPQGERFDVARAMMGLTLSIVSKALFGTALRETDLETVHTVLPRLLATGIRRANTPFDWLERLPTQTNRQFERDAKALDAIIYRIIAERRARGADGDDLLGMLMAAQDADSGETMSDRQLRDEAMTLFLAGHETTANLLSWTWVLLSQHPEVRARLHRELDEGLAGRTPTSADVPRLPYTNAVIQEVLRHYPPVWATGRRPYRDDAVDGYRVEAGQNVILAFYTLHHDERYWSRPLAFRPERFLPPESEERAKGVFLPFGAGPRQCIGNHFALLEAALVLATVLQRVDLELSPPGSVPETEVTLTLRPKAEVGVVATPRC